MSSTAQKVEVVGVTLTGALVGAMVGGPMGAGIGLTVGVVIDFLILHKKTQPLGTIPPPGIIAAVSAGLPAGANTDAANRAVTMMKLGNPSEVGPAKSWLTAFQASVNLPATGQLDPTTRAMLILAVPSASSLPTPTILG